MEAAQRRQTKLWKTLSSYLWPWLWSTPPVRLWYIFFNSIYTRYCYSSRVHCSCSLFSATCSVRKTSHGFNFIMLFFDILIMIYERRGILTRYVLIIFLYQERRWPNFQFVLARSNSNSIRKYYWEKRGAWVQIREKETEIFQIY